MKITELLPVYVEEMPEVLEEGKLYISEKHIVAIHLCACGCGEKTVTPLGKRGWMMIRNANLITLRPSIGNFSGEKPYHAHYWVTDNKVIEAQ